MRSISTLSICSYLLLAVLFGHCGFAAAQTVSASTQPRQALILARPVAMKLARELASTDPDALVVGSVYVATLRSIRVAYGALTFKEPQQVEITASDARVVMMHPEIYLLLEIGQDSSIKVLDWGVPEKVVCIPSKLRSKVQLGPDFAGYEAKDGALCAPSQIHR